MSFFDDFDFLFPGEFGDTIVNRVNRTALRKLDMEFCIGYKPSKISNPFYKNFNSGLMNVITQRNRNVSSSVDMPGINNEKAHQTPEVIPCINKTSLRLKYKDKNDIFREPELRFDIGRRIEDEVVFIENYEVNKRGGRSGFSSSIFSSETILSFCEIIRVELKRKDNLLFNLIDHYQGLKRNNKAISSFCVSFGLEPSVKLSPLNTKYSVSAHLEILGGALKRFFNLARNRASFAYILGYFWVVMRGGDGIPYLHLNFYINSDKFGQRLAEDINSTWMKATDGIGYIVHYSHRLKFNILGMTTVNIERLGLDDSIFKYLDRHTFEVLTIKYIEIDEKTVDEHTWSSPVYSIDLNGKKSTKEKHFASAQKKELFIPYLRRIAMEAFHYPEKRVFGLSQRRTKKVKLGKFPNKRS